MFNSKILCPQFLPPWTKIQAEYRWAY